MLKTFKTKGIGAGSFFKVLFIGNFVCFLLATIITGIIAWLMPQSIAAMKEQQYAVLAGPIGIIVYIVLSPIYALILSFFQWLAIGFGLWLWTRFCCVRITLSVVDECCDKPNDGQCH